ncbi:S-layer homology domain-containing protein [Paenibacillus gorillae]|uniref:S-layer homology domain-containing protein n=1 Tax=Paenibacillus gorillae TaxID=1243662 RepID=UPI0004BCCB00|nr:S-layer homology domain-containing protein [Paenibacillus gorillae]
MEEREARLKGRVILKFTRFVMSAVLLTVLFGAASANAQSKTFKDVDATFWGYEAIQWGVEQNIVKGYEDDTFRPDRIVTEEEFIVLLVRAFGITVSPLENQRWSAPYYIVAHQHNLPVLSTYVAPISRQTVAEIIVGTRGVNFMGNDAISYLLNKGLSKGKSSATLEGYEGKGLLTRAEAIAFIKNVMDKTGSKVMGTRPQEKSPTFLLAQSEELQLTNPKAIEALQQTIRYFNDGLKQTGLDSSYYVGFETLTFTENLYNKDSNSKVYNTSKSVKDSSSVKFVYSLTIATNARTGEIDRISVWVQEEEKVKDIVLSTIYALMQDAEKSKQFYEKNQFSSSIDAELKASKNKSISATEGPYKGTYYLMKLREVGKEGPFTSVHTFEMIKV